MKEIIRTIFLFSLLTNSLLSQDNYENGYYINNSNDTIFASILYKEWKTNPKSISIIEENDISKQNIQLHDINEFTVFNKVKFVKKTIEIDRSNQNLEQLSNNRNPEFITETILLKVIVEGETNLYYYNKGNTIKYFYDSPNLSTQQLIYKLYRKDNQVIKNSYFKQQLLNSFQCDELGKKDFEKLKYSLTHLSEIFLKYNKCRNSSYVDYSQSSNKGQLNIYSTFGIRNSNLDFSNNDTSLRNKVFKSNSEYSLGIYFEYILPFRNGRWTVFIEPTYHKYSNDGIIEYQILTNDTISVNYKTIELPIV